MLWHIFKSCGMCFFLVGEGISSHVSAKGFLLHKMQLSRHNKAIGRLPEIHPCNPLRSSCDYCLLSRAEPSATDAQRFFSENPHIFLFLNFEQERYCFSD